TSLRDDLDKIKKEYTEEQRKIHQKYTENLNAMNQSWLIMQQQVDTQTQMVTTMNDIIGSTLFTTCSIVISSVCLTLEKMKNGKNNAELDGIINVTQQQLTLLNNEKSIYLTHQSSLQQLLNKQKLALNSALRVGKQLRNMPKIPSFYWESVEGSNSFGGVAILLHQSISSKIIEKQENFLMLEIETENEKILLGGIYVPPKSKTPFELFEKHVGKNFFIFGDYNAKHVQWNCSNNNTSGNEIKEWMDQNGCEMTHPLSTTSKRSEAIIDFMIAQDITGWNCEVLEVGLWDRCSIYESVEKYRPPWPQHLILLAKTVNKHKRKYRKTHYVRHYEEWAY
ncbi:unnamed protein product, partial [Rotaria magnacalcarata]